MYTSVLSLKILTFSAQIASKKTDPIARLPPPSYLISFAILYIFPFVRMSFGT